jgi:hypothetical protein
MKDFGFYLVMTNPVVGYAKCAEAAVKAGVKIFLSLLGKLGKAVEYFPCKVGKLAKSLFCGSDRAVEIVFVAGDIENREIDAFDS